MGRQPTNQPKSPHPSPPRSQPRSPHLSLRAEMMTPILPMMLLHRNLSLGAEMMVLVVILPMMLLHRNPFNRTNLHLYHHLLINSLLQSLLMLVKKLLERTTTIHRMELYRIV